MTVPWLMNCSHRPDGWCLECAKELGQENWSLIEERDKLKDKCAALELEVARWSKLWSSAVRERNRLASESSTGGDQE